MNLKTNHFKIEYHNNEFIDWIEKAFEESYLELSGLLNKEMSEMPVIIFKNQKEFHEYIKENYKPRFGDKPWFIAWSNNGPGNKPILFAPPSDWPEMEKPRNYIQIKKLIKHELAHRFTDRKMPLSIHEGIACFLAEQKKSEKKLRQVIEKDGYVSLYENTSFVLYFQAPFFINWLVDKFGIEKLITFVKKDSKFEEDFKEVYGKSFVEMEKQWKKEFNLNI